MHTAHSTPSFNFTINSSLPVSQAFLSLGLTDFTGAAAYVKALPYARNHNKTDILCPLTEQCGTCSTKHALLRQLAAEHNQDNIRLTMGIFKMNARNTPEVAATLTRHSLEYIPDAHCYLTIGNHIADYTKQEWTTSAFAADLLQETYIQPHQTGDYKVALHKAYLNKWLLNNPQIPYTLDELFAIREACIKDLFTHK